MDGAGSPPARPVNDRPQAPEAPFLDLAEDLVRTSPLPLMLTGGITRRDIAERDLDTGVAVVGMGTATTLTPGLPERWRNHREADRRMEPATWSGKALASAAGMARVRHPMRRFARGRGTRFTTGPALALLSERRGRRRALRGCRVWPATTRRTEQA
ncbi:hypothetical protein ACIQJ4_10450 [Streptomyces filamentosus]|uniref:hypothetical protein n=1 Tax=Streptomyces filamentosus TaxID=67294 RepID=UPI0038115F59